MRKEIECHYFRNNQILTLINPPIMPPKNNNYKKKLSEYKINESKLNQFTNT